MKISYIAANKSMVPRNSKMRRDSILKSANFHQKEGFGTSLLFAI
jgi:hypothetical protein